MNGSKTKSASQVYIVSTSEATDAENQNKIVCYDDEIAVGNDVHKTLRCRVDGSLHHHCSAADLLTCNL